MLRSYVQLVLILLVSISFGCNEPEQIRQYRVEKSRSDLGEIGAKKLPEAATNPSQPVASRMVVAIAVKSDATWFYKITGSIPAVNESESEWQAFLKSIEYGSDGKPEWKLPEGWILGPPKPMRFATVLNSSSSDGRVEISVSSLGPNQDLLNNVNRWRNQLGLKPIAQDELELTTIESSAGEMKVFDATGMLASNSMMAPPNVSGPPQPELSYDIPDGWSESRKSMMVPVRLRHGSDKAAPQITVTQLLAAVNEWLPNAQRWAGQVGISTEAKELENLTDDVTIDNITGKRIRLIPTDDESKFAMVGAMVVKEDIAWFFKFIGEKKFVEDNQPMFDQFLESFKFQKD